MNANLPKRNGFLSAWLGRAVLRTLGWQIQGTLPDFPKSVLIVAPHTSNWDFIVGIAAMLSLRLAANWLGKSSLFFWPLGALLRRLGGIPVDRSSPQGTVDQVVDLFKNREQIVLGLSPEGTRKKVNTWKTGFYQIALGAGVPVVLISLDYSKRILGIGPSLNPSGDLEKDLQNVRAYYSAVQGKHPELFSLPGEPAVKKQE